jgi:hypothetical protein
MAMKPDPMGQGLAAWDQNGQGQKDTEKNDKSFHDLLLSDLSP